MSASINYHIQRHCCSDTYSASSNAVDVGRGRPIALTVYSLHNLIGCIKYLFGYAQAFLIADASDSHKMRKVYIASSEMQNLVVEKIRSAFFVDEFIEDHIRSIFAKQGKNLKEIKSLEVVIKEIQESIFIDRRDVEIDDSTILGRDHFE